MFETYFRNSDYFSTICCRDTFANTAQFRISEPKIYEEPVDGSYLNDMIYDTG